MCNTRRAGGGKRGRRYRWKSDEVREDIGKENIRCRGCGKSPGVLAGADRYLLHVSHQRCALFIGAIIQRAAFRPRDAHCHTLIAFVMGLWPARADGTRETRRFEMIARPPHYPRTSVKQRDSFSPGQARAVIVILLPSGFTRVGNLPDYLTNLPIASA